MTNHYSQKRFFREAPNRFLQQYFTEKKVLLDFDFSQLNENKIDPLYDSWLVLPEQTRINMERDFQEIDDLACEGGSKAILDEANFHQEDLSEQFSNLEGFLERSFWTYLEKRDFWNGAIAFHHADTLPSSYWRKRKNVPQKSADVTPQTIQAFEKALGQYFHVTQGRGKNCKIDCYKRHDLDYFFAYPEDYAQASIEWEGAEFKKRPHHPAFEIIFVYSQKDGTLDLYLKGDRKIVPELQDIFAEVILHDSLGDDQTDERVYDLAPLKSRHFEFQFSPESGIESVTIKKLRLNVLGTKERITLEADSKYNKHAVFDLLDKLTKNSFHLQYSLGQVGIKVTFPAKPNSKRINTRSFDITWPNSCSLKHDDRDLRIRKMLAESGIEPKKGSKIDGAVS